MSILLQPKYSVFGQVPRYDHTGTGLRRQFLGLNYPGRSRTRVCTTGVPIPGYPGTDIENLHPKILFWVFCVVSRERKSQIRFQKLPPPLCCFAPTDPRVPGYPSASLQFAKTRCRGHCPRNPNVVQGSQCTQIVAGTSRKFVGVIHTPG